MALSYVDGLIGLAADGNTLGLLYHKMRELSAMVYII